MLPMVEDFVQRFKLDDFVVVADSGLMNKSNVSLLESGHYKYILGARIKNGHEETRQWILSMEKHDGEFNGLQRDGPQVDYQLSGIKSKERQVQQ